MLFCKSHSALYWWPRNHVSSLGKALMYTHKHTGTLWSHTPIIATVFLRHRRAVWLSLSAACYFQWIHQPASAQNVRNDEKWPSLKSRVQHIVLKLMIFFDQELNDFFFIQIQMKNKNRQKLDILTNCPKSALVSNPRGAEFTVIHIKEHIWKAGSWHFHFIQLYFFKK